METKRFSAGTSVLITPVTLCLTAVRLNTTGLELKTKQKNNSTSNIKKELKSKYMNKIIFSLTSETFSLPDGVFLLQLSFNSGL